ncbi:hypothetical protein KJ628_06035 [Patescibacteria group bacterium]|nr:hypothetical protein [Patescibacteria group bacterium]
MATEIRGKVVKMGTEKQIKYATDILERINGALAEIEGIAPITTTAVYDELQKLTIMVEGGAGDIINYMSNWNRETIIMRAYHTAERVLRNKEEKAALKPLVEELYAIPARKY